MRSIAFENTHCNELDCFVCYIQTIVVDMLGVAMHNQMKCWLSRLPNQLTNPNHGCSHTGNLVTVQSSEAMMQIK